MQQRLHVLGYNDNPCSFNALSFSISISSALFSPKHNSMESTSLISEETKPYDNNISPFDFSPYEIKTCKT
jgi:hypothetical protein